MMDQNVSNGINVQVTKTGMSSPRPSQAKSQHQYNGVNSSQSSKSSSPTHFVPIPSSQLPPARSFIPQSQLPPNRVSSDIGSVTENKQLTVVSPLASNYNSKTCSSTPSVPSSQQGSHPQLFVGQNLSPVPKIDLKNNNSENISKSSSTIHNVALSNTNKLNNIPVASPSHISSSSGAPKQSLNVNQDRTMTAPASVLSSNNSVNYIHPSTNYRPVGSLNESQNMPVKLPVNMIQNSGIEYNSDHRKQLLLQASSQASFQPQNKEPKLPTNQSHTSNITESLQQISLQEQHNFNKLGLQNVNVQNGPASSYFNQNRSTLHSNRYPQSSISNQPQLYQQQQGFSENLQQENVYSKQNVIQQPYQQATQQPQPYQQTTQQPQPYQQTTQQPEYKTQQPYQSIATTGFSKYWGTENYDLLQNPNILPPSKIEPPKVSLGNEVLNEINCSPDIIRCTMTKIPENNSLLQKSRLPLGILIHPFKDLTHLNVVSCNVIVRCRACRTYINPFVYFVDNKRWKCNLCYRINELPEEFMYDPYTKSYGDPSRRPEIKTSTIEYIAPAEYMLRPPQPAVYLYLLDVSRLAVESGYLSLFSQILLDELGEIPGDARTQIGFIAYDSALHFFSLAEGLNQPHEMTVLDIDDVFLPTPDNLLVNLKDRFELVSFLLQQLPTRYNHTFDNNSALGAALQVAYKLMGATGGRVTVFQASLPNIGPGSLTSREDPSQRASAEVAHLNPATDFYKRLALECSGQQIAVDLFIVNSQYVDIATISGISRFSGGCVYHFPLFKVSKTLQAEEFERNLRRYLTRKIGFEAVMRVRCTRGLAIHTFHGNFFVRSTDLLSLPNVNPDSGFGMQVSIEENLSDVQTVCFQAALLYTSSKGERRIRVHTICLPVVATVHDIIHSADQQAIVGLLAKMAVDRSTQSSLSDAREAFINVAVDILSSYKLTLNLGSPISGLLAPNCLRILPLYISALLKHIAFKTGTSTRLDDRVKAMIDMKTKPLSQLIRMIYPDLYPIHNLEDQEVILNGEEEPISIPPKLQLTSRCLDSKGSFLMDTGDHMLILICPNVSQTFLNDILGIPDYSSITDQMYEIPIYNNLSNERLHRFIEYLNDDRPFPATLQIIRDNSPLRMSFFGKLIEDRADNALSYHEFLQHLKSQVK